MTLHEQLAHRILEVDRCLVNMYKYDFLLRLGKFVYNHKESFLEATELWSNRKIELTQPTQGRNPEVPTLSITVAEVVDLLNKFDIRLENVEKKMYNNSEEEKSNEGPNSVRTDSGSS